MKLTSVKIAFIIIATALLTWAFQNVPPPQQLKTVQFVVHLDLDTSKAYMLIAQTDTHLEGLNHGEFISADTILTDGADRYYTFTLNDVLEEEDKWQVEAYRLKGDSITWVMSELGTFNQ